VKLSEGEKDAISKKLREEFRSKFVMLYSTSIEKNNKKDQTFYTLKLSFDRLDA